MPLYKNKSHYRNKHNYNHRTPTKGGIPFSSSSHSQQQPPPYSSISSSSTSSAMMMVSPAVVVGGAGLADDSCCSAEPAEPPDTGFMMGSGSSWNLSSSPSSGSSPSSFFSRQLSFTRQQQQQQQSPSPQQQQPQQYSPSQSFVSGLVPMVVSRHHRRTSSNNSAISVASSNASNGIGKDGNSPKEGGGSGSGSWSSNSPLSQAYKSLVTPLKRPRPKSGPIQSIFKCPKNTQQEKSQATAAQNPVSIELCRSDTSDSGFSSLSSTADSSCSRPKKMVRFGEDEKMDRPGMDVADMEAMGDKDAAIPPTPVGNMIGTVAQRSRIVVSVWPTYGSEAYDRTPIEPSENLCLPKRESDKCSWLKCFEREKAKKASLKAAAAKAAQQQGAAAPGSCPPSPPQPPLLATNRLAFAKIESPPSSGLSPKIARLEMPKCDSSASSISSSDGEGAGSSHDPISEGSSFSSATTAVDDIAVISLDDGGQPSKDKDTWVPPSPVSISSHEEEIVMLGGRSKDEEPEEIEIEEEEEEGAELQVDDDDVEDDDATADGDEEEEDEEEVTVEHEEADEDVEFSVETEEEDAKTEVDETEGEQIHDPSIPLRESVSNALEFDRLEDTTTGSSPPKDPHPLLQVPPSSPVRASSPKIHVSPRPSPRTTPRTSPRTSPRLGPTSRSGSPTPMSVDGADASDRESLNGDKEQKEKEKENRRKKYGMCGMGKWSRDEVYGACDALGGF